MEVSFFTIVRKVTVILFIIFVVLLAFLGILSIWDFLSDDVFGKAMGSILLLCMSSVLIIVAAMERENNPLLVGKAGAGKPFSIGRILIILALVYFAFTFLAELFYNSFRVMY